MRVISKLLLVFSLAGLITACPETTSVETKPPVTKTITGKVVDQNGRLALSAEINKALTVTTLGNKTSTAVNADGTFTLANVSVPYTAVLQTAVQGGAKIAWVFKGISRLDPTLTVTEFFPSIISEPYVTTLSGTITGGAGFSSGSKAQTLLSYGFANSIDPSNGGLQEPDSSTGKYSGFATWRTTNPVDGFLSGLQVTLDANGKINAYTGYGKTPVKLTGALQSQPVTQTIKDLALAAIPSTTLSGTITWPDLVGTPSYRLNTTWTPNPNESINFPLSDLNFAAPGTVKPDALNQLVPVLAGSSYLVGATLSVPPVQSGSEYQESGIFKYATPGTALNLTVPAPPSPQTPPAKGTGVTNDTTFSWTPFTGGVHIVSLTPFPQGSNATLPASIRVITTDSSLTFTDLNAIGLGLGKGFTYLWSIAASAPYATMDAATGPGGIVTRSSYSGTPITTEASFGNVRDRLFTTAP
jgi:hypothetical protein